MKRCRAMGRMERAGGGMRWETRKIQRDGGTKRERIVVRPRKECYEQRNKGIKSNEKESEKK